MHFLSNLWGRIKSADLGQFFPKQQGESLGRLGDIFPAQPYGMYANLPNGQLFKVLDEDGRVVMGVTVERPPNVEQNEVSIWHPSTGTVIHLKNNGDLNIDTAVTNKGDVNINTVNANLTASEDVNVICRNADLAASDDVDVTCNNATVNATLKADVNSNTSTVTCITSLALIAPITTVNSTTSITFTTPLAAFVGNLSVSGTLLNAGVNVGSTHTHTQANDSGGNTESDTGVPQ